MDLIVAEVNSLHRMWEKPLFPSVPLSFWWVPKISLWFVYLKEQDSGVSLFLCERELRLNNWVMTIPQFARLVGFHAPAPTLPTIKVWPHMLAMKVSNQSDQSHRMSEHFTKYDANQISPKFHQPAPTKNVPKKTMPPFLF